VEGYARYLLIVGGGFRVGPAFAYVRQEGVISRGVA
jgi:hypothetical protein